MSTVLDTSDPDAQAILRYGPPAVRIAATADRAAVRGSMLLEARYSEHQVAEELAAWVAAHPEQAARVVSPPSGVVAHHVQAAPQRIIPTDACGL